MHKFDQHTDSVFNSVYGHAVFKTYSSTVENALRELYHQCGVESIIDGCVGHVDLVAKLVCRRQDQHRIIVGRGAMFINVCVNMQKADF